MITDKQREKRRNYIGGSDAAAILGVDPWKTKADLWLEKTGRLEDRPLDSKPAELGNDIEDSLLRWFGREYKLPERGLMLLRNQHFVTDPFGPHLDAAIVPAGKRGRADITEIIEAKYTGLVDEWGDELTDQVPDRVLVQTHVQMYATGDQCRTAWAVVMLPGYRSIERRRYRIDRNDELTKAIVEAGQEFWEYVESDTPPPDSYPSLDVLKQRARTPRSLAELDEAALQVIAQWELIKGQKSGAESELKEVQARVIGLLGDAEGAVLPDGRTITFLEQNSPPSVDHAGFKMAHPDLYNRFVKQGRHRSLRIAEPKVKGAWK